MSEAARILVVEDESHIAAGVKLNLELEGYSVVVARSGREAGALLLSGDGFHVILLDVMLPDVDGFSFCRSLRQAGNLTPVLMLTARDAVEDRVRGLEVGADDYLTKPFELAELLARVRSLLRRQSWERENHESVQGRHILRLGDALIDFGSREVQCPGRSLHLTKLEFDLLQYFAEHPGRVISREELQEKVWKVSNYSSARMVDNFLMRLRRHFEDDPSNPVYFVSVRGSGYKFVLPT